MKKIFIRSPYFIEVDESEQSEVKVEIFLWNKGMNRQSRVIQLQKEFRVQLKIK